MYSLLKIFHVSDLHVGKSGMKERVKLLFESINEEKKNTHCRSVLVMTGDLVDSATKKQFQELGEMMVNFLTNFKKKEILIVPGNHDYDGIMGSAFLFGKKNFTDFHENYVLENQKSSFPSFKRFECKLQGAKCPYYVDLVGIDSMLGQQTFDKTIEADGEIGKKQMDDINDYIEKQKGYSFKIAYLHHHPKVEKKSLRLDDRKRFIKGMNELGFDLVLFGHHHPIKSESFKIEKVRYYCACSSTDASEKSKRLNYSTIDLKLDKNGKQIIIEQKKVE